MMLAIFLPEILLEIDSETPFEILFGFHANFLLALFVQRSITVV